jgi:hypothetical protein
LRADVALGAAIGEGSNFFEQKIAPFEGAVGESVVTVTAQLSDGVFVGTLRNLNAVSL